MSSRRTVTLFARGHPNVKATHAKTLELVPEADLGPRGTCIVGVGLSGDLAGLAGLRGRVRFALRCGDREEAVTATLNPAWLPGEPPILRTRAEPLARRTLAFGADKGAGGLDRAFVRALADPQAGLEIAVTPEAAPPPPGAVFLAQPGGPADARLERAQAVADLRLADGCDGLAAAIAAGARVLLETADRLLQAEAVATTAAAGGLATLVGAWPAGAGARALSGIAAATWLETDALGQGGTVQIGTKLGGKARRAALARLRRAAETAAAALLLPVPAGLGEAVLGDAAKTFGARDATLVVDPGGPDEAVRRGPLERIATARPPAGSAWLAVAPPLAAPDAGEIDPALLAFARRLRAEGVATKSLATALAAVAGMPKRAAFNLLVELEKEDSGA